jgi:hypothetical protein
VDDRFASLRNATASALFGAAGATDAELRRTVAAGTPPPELATLVQKIRSRAYTVTDQDLDALRSRYTFGAAQERLAATQRALEDA